MDGADAIVGHTLTLALQILQQNLSQNTTSHSPDVVSHCLTISYSVM